MTFTDSGDMKKIIEEEGVATTLHKPGDSDTWHASIMIGEHVWTTITAPTRDEAMYVARNRLDALMVAVYPVERVEPRGFGGESGPPMF